MLQIEIEYLMEARGNVKPYAGESMVPGRGYWFGVYWRVIGDKDGSPSLAKNCLTHKEALDYIRGLKEESTFRDAEVVDHSAAWLG